MIGATPYALAVRDRLIARPRCDWPEIAIVGDPIRAAVLATAMRRAGIAVATYYSLSQKSQLKRAIADEADYVVFADTLKIRDLIVGTEWLLDPSSPVVGALFAVNCGYLPLEITGYVL